MPRHETPQKLGSTSVAPTEENLADQREFSCSRAGEDSYRFLFDKSPLPAWVFDRETLAFLAVNEATVHQYGFSRQEMLALTIKDILVAESLPHFPAVGGGSGEGNTFAWVTRKKDGTVVSAQVNWQHVRFAGRVAILVLVRSLTVRGQAEEASQESRQRKDDFLAVLGAGPQ